MHWNIPEGQPYCLHALASLNSFIGNKDTTLFTALLQQVSIMIFRFRAHWMLRSLRYMKMIFAFVKRIGQARKLTLHCCNLRLLRDGFRCLA